MYLIDFWCNGEDTIAPVGIILVIVQQVFLLGGIEGARGDDFGYYRGIKGLCYQLSAKQGRLVLAFVEIKDCRTVLLALIVPLPV
jgi:hypothetical protein